MYIMYTISTFTNVIPLRRLLANYTARLDDKRQYLAAPAQVNLPDKHGYTGAYKNRRITS